MGEGEVWDGNCNTMLEYSGRTFPSPCGSHGTELFYTNDEGTYVVKIRGTHPERMREIAELDDLEKLVETFKDRRIQIGEGRIDIPHSSPALMSLNTLERQPARYHALHAGLRRHRGAHQRRDAVPRAGKLPVDATDDMKPLGCAKWVEEGLATIPAPYQMLEPLVAMGASNIEVGFMSQNILLAESALGLGGWPFGGFTAMMVLGGTPICRGLGFRFETAQHGPIGGIPLSGGEGRGVRDASSPLLRWIHRRRRG